ncbi:nucleotidyltransferase domain-containing protein [bacterium D16-76]|jgi:predicted nucleotidyltransferase|uniref:nucleotidyltransferase domain-containing protein n=1 Tax=Acutalibacter muris TaxID=1796620 RepID=UPI00136E66D4|nr:nucleotidyltransferase domain-containing protein [Acutalibacter muris]NBJ90043.1 nucleotidyltransferase domain-containing protein [Acutalibacter sp. 1XD8-36]NBK77228.1 nucleotidyltransferase domain-containing protein [bacterium D16-76]
MDYSLSETLKVEIIDLALQCQLDRVILFGSRSRGDNRERSDIDLAIQGGDTVAFAASADEDIPTLLMFDVVDLDKPVQSELLEEIRKDGVVIYEKV